MTEDRGAVDAADLEDEFERLGRLAGSELRASAPEPDVGLVAHTVTRRRQRRAAAVTAVVLLIVLIGLARAWTADPPDQHLQTVTSTTIEPKLRDHFVLRGLPSLAGALDISDDGLRAASQGDDGTLIVWDLVTGRQLQSIQTGSTYDTAVGLDRHGTKVAVRSSDVPQPSTRAWTVATGEATTPFAHDWNENPLGQAGSPVVSPSGDVRAELGPYGPATLVDVRTGRLLHTLVGSGSRTHAAAFSPDGSRLAVKMDRSVRVFDVVSGAQVGEIALPPYRATGEVVIFTPDGTHVASTVENEVIVDAIP